MSENIGMDTREYIYLADGTYAALDRSMTYGDAVIILLLVSFVFLQLYKLWRIG